MVNEKSTERLDKVTIESVISPESRLLLSRLEILETIDSTNTYLLAQSKAHTRSGYVCLAEEQTKGRGRQGKEWFSPKGVNIYCSVLWMFPAAQTDISHLSLAVAVMIVNALQRYGIEEGLQLKWPNDIYYANRKLAGVLIEAIPSRVKDYPVVIGLGLNLALTKDHPLKQSAVGVADIVGNQAARNLLAGLIIDELLRQLPVYVASGFPAFLPEWRKHDMLAGNSTVIHTAQTEISGVAQGINHAGELVVRVEDGAMHTFRCGEVSVRLKQR